MTNSGSAIGKMTGNLLFEHFATLATAPEGIARLRELILQLAVQGKLGTQDAGDEPASLLLGRIKKEKDRLVKQGKIPKEKSVEYENETLDRPLPEHWILVRLEEISDKIHYGYTASADQTNRRIRLLRITDIQNNRVNWDLVPGCEIDDSNFLSYTINVGDLLIARTGGTVGKSFLVRDQPTPAVFASYLIRVVPNKNLNSEYVKLFADSPTYWDQLYRMCMGTGQPNVNGMSLRSLIVPLPPLAEQHRIVAKVDRLMALCDELEARQKQEQAGCLKLGTASLAGLQNAERPEEFERQWAQLCDAFDLILDCPENVAVLRQTILQLAVQGRLGTQNPKDEPADKLFTRIKKEREQFVKGKPIVIRPLENPKLPTLPNQWIWVRLGDVLADIRYGTSEKSDYQFGGIPVIRIPNIGNGILNFNDMKYLQIKEEIDTHKIKNGDLLTIRSNGSRDLVGKCAVAKNIDRSIAFASYLIRLRPILVNSEFLALALSSQNVRDQFFSSAKTTSGVHNINTEELARTLFALPPLAEQHRIVAKVDTLMKLCDELQGRLKERAAVQGRFAATVGKQVAEGV